MVDKAEPYYELMYLPFEKNASCPKFKDTVRNSVISEGEFVTNDILSDKKFQKIIAEKGLSTLAK